MIDRTGSPSRPVLTAAMSAARSFVSSSAGLSLLSAMTSRESAACYGSESSGRGLLNPLQVSQPRTVPAGAATALFVDELGLVLGLHLS